MIVDSSHRLAEGDHPLDHIVKRKVAIERHLRALT